MITHCNIVSFIATANVRFAAAQPPTRKNKVACWYIAMLSPSMNESKKPLGKYMHLI